MDIISIIVCRRLDGDGDLARLAASRVCDAAVGRGDGGSHESRSTFARRRRQGRSTLVAVTRAPAAEILPGGWRKTFAFLISVGHTSRPTVETSRSGLASKNGHTDQIELGLTHRLSVRRVKLSPWTRYYILHL